MDLYVDTDRPRELTAQLYAQLRDAVASGRLSPGDRLPTSRALAADVAVSRSTIATVYGRLVAEGVLEARVGRGTFVADRGRGGAGRASRDTGPTVRRAAPAPPAPAVPHDVRIDLRTGRPDPGLFPLKPWRRAVREVIETPPPGYGDPAGLPELRAALATWTRRTRGLDVEADEVLVTSGAQQAFDLCARSLVGGGGTAAVEDPGYEPARRAFVAHGARIQPVAVDREGIAVDAIDPAAHLVMVTPSHQSPTGVTMSPARRRQLLEMAYNRDMVVVEDDYDTEFRYVDRPLEPLHRLDPSGRVVYVGTFSKSLSPSLRIGYVMARPTVIEQLTATRTVSDGQPPHLVQAALARMVVAGELDRHLRRARTAYAARYEVVCERVADLHRRDLIPQPWPSHAGLHVMVELHAGVDAADVSTRLAADGVVVPTTADAWCTPATPALTIGFGLTDVDQLHEAFDLLDRILGRGS